jgi:hypothetical protein
MQGLEMLRFIMILAAVLILPSCAKEPDMGQMPDASRTPLSVSQAVDPTNAGRTIVVRADVAKVCQTEGCWMDVTDGTSTLRLTFKDEAFAMPLDMTGTIVAEGVVTEEIEDGRRVARMVATGVRTVE